MTLRRTSGKSRGPAGCPAPAPLHGRKAAATTSKRSVLNSASMSRRTASRSTLGGHDDAAAFEFRPLTALEGKPVQPPLLIRRQFRVGIDRPRTAGQQCVEPLAAQFDQQRLTQSVDLRTQARQIVDEAIPKGWLNRLAFGALSTACFHGSMQLHGDHMPSGDIHVGRVIVVVLELDVLVGELRQRLRACRGLSCWRRTYIRRRKLPSA